MSKLRLVEVEDVLNVGGFEPVGIKRAAKFSCHRSLLRFDRVWRSFQPTTFDDTIIDYASPLYPDFTIERDENEDEDKFIVIKVFQGKMVSGMYNAYPTLTSAICAIMRGDEN